MERCTGQCVGKGMAHPCHLSALPSPHLHGCKTRRLSEPRVYITLYNHDRLNYWPLAIDSTLVLSPLLPEVGVRLKVPTL